jgi:hypothetical protein
MAQQPVASIQEHTLYQGALRVITDGDSNEVIQEQAECLFTGWNKPDARRELPHIKSSTVFRT